MQSGCRGALGATFNHAHARARAHILALGQLDSHSTFTHLWIDSKKNLSQKHTLSQKLTFIHRLIESQKIYSRKTEMVGII